MTATGSSRATLAGLAAASAIAPAFGINDGRVFGEVYGAAPIPFVVAR